ncbi:hypothetical protein E2C01_073750 [Portunus trituberculatus]|uniref:Insertion element IS150 protein InsJ-like helix-turn-helix domain-containing protein n=1 Tax=Portunus trituberculatus TaxID=210409 RepID=A0A5B7IEP6_PORTR|nr:hypothetical protein [Portunus trituberculatus]
MGLRKLISKAQISVICALVRKNKSNQEIAANTGIALRTVQRWTKIYREGGRDASPPPHKPKGRKRSVSQRTLNIIRRQLEANPRIHSKELRARNPALLAEVSERSVRRYVKCDLGYRSCHAVSKARLTPGHLNSRLTFVSQHKDWDLDKWRRVLWSDEASFQVTDNQRNRVYHRPSSNHYDPH